MAIEILTGSDVPTLLARAQLLIGEDAVVVSVRRILDGRRPAFEMVAADPVTASEHRRRDRLRPVRGEGAAALLRADEGAQPPSAPRRAFDAPEPEARRRERPAPDPAAAEATAAPPRRRWTLPSLRRAHAPAPSRADASRRPHVVVLVGPTGAGKTTTIAKLATHALAYGGRRVGVLCLDTWRVGALEQARQFAELAKLPFEVAYEAAELEPAMRRLAGCDVVLVDTPGRGPKAAADLREAQALVKGLEPDEVHLVAPAGLQRALARDLFTAHLPFGVTHLLVTKLDEYPGERSLFELAGQFALPMRWVGDGQEIARHLQAAPDTSAAPRGAAGAIRYAEAM